MSVIIRLQGLPLSAASADIRTFFAGLRIPDGAVNIVGGDDGDAFIGFATDDDARQAMRKDHGQIHNAEVRLLLSSRSEMNEVIDRARSAPAAPMNPPSLPPPAYGSAPPTRFEREEPPRFPPREDPSRFGRDIPPYSRNGPQFGREEPQRYGRSDTQPMGGNSRPPFTPHGGFHQTGRTAYEGHFDSRKDEGEKIRSPTDRPQYGMHNDRSEKNDQRKSDDMGSRNAPWMMNRDRERGDNGHQKSYGGYAQPPPVIRQEDADRRPPMNIREVDNGMRGNIRQDADERKDRKKEESWRSENTRSFDRPHTVYGQNGSAPQEEDSVSFFGRGPPQPKKTLLPPPLMAPPPLMPSILQAQPPSQSPTEQKPKEEVFVELTRLPPDLLRPSVLEEFLAPATPLTLSSVKVVYSPEGIHLHSLVRFTSAMDAFNALKKDGEQGVKIRPSTKESFDAARDGLPPTFPLVAPSQPPSITSMPPFPPAMPMAPGMMPPGMGRMGQFPMPMPMPLMNPSEMMGFDRRVSGEMDDGRGERRRRQDSPPRGRREERRKRSNSPSNPRPKKQKIDRVCVHISNLPFRVKEPEIRRMLGPGLNPFAIKKIFTEDNTPSDVWVMEFSSEPEAQETVRRRMELGGRQARLRMIDEPEADRLLRQKFKSPPRRTEKEEKADSFDEKVRMQQEAIEMEKARQNGPGRHPSEDTGALAGAFSAPVFTTNRGFMRGGRGGGGVRGMRGMNGSMRGGRGGLQGGPHAMPGNGERNCLLVSNMPPLPSPQVLLEHLRIVPAQFVRVDQIAPDAAIIELRGEKDAVIAADTASSTSFPHLNGRRLIIAAMSRRQIEEEFNLRGAGDVVMDRRRNSSPRRTNSPPSHHHRNDKRNSPPLRNRIDPEIVRSIGEPGCVIACDGFPRDLAIDEVAAFFKGFPIVEASVRMRMENGEGTGECMLAMRDGSAARRAVTALHGRRMRGNTVKLSLLE